MNEGVHGLSGAAGSASSGSGSAAAGSAAHELQLVGRKRLHVSGVTQVASFDEREIVLDTRSGSLTIRGEGLHMTLLDLDSGRFAVAGLINVMQYGPSLRDRESGRPRARNLFERLLR